jgi:serine/threonine protein kinase
VRLWARRRVVDWVQVHGLGFLHRDVKPANFALGRRPGTIGTCYVIDFGLARKYVDDETGAHRPPRETAGFRGTSRYASLRAHQLQELSRRDDLWSVVFMLAEFLAGSLPWGYATDRDKIGAMKEAWVADCLSGQGLQGRARQAARAGLATRTASPGKTALPHPIPAMARQLAALGYSDAPDYDQLCALFDQPDVSGDSGPLALAEAEAEAGGTDALPAPEPEPEPGGGPLLSRSRLMPRPPASARPPSPELFRQLFGRPPGAAAGGLSARGRRPGRFVATAALLDEAGADAVAAPSVRQFFARAKPKTTCIK